jgi:hypothetical protein
MLTFHRDVERIEISAVPVVYLTVARLAEQARILDDLTVTHRHFAEP